MIRSAPKWTDYVAATFVCVFGAFAAAIFCMFVFIGTQAMVLAFLDEPEFPNFPWLAKRAVGLLGIFIPIYLSASILPRGFRSRSALYSGTTIIILFSTLAL